MTHTGEMSVHTIHKYVLEIEDEQTIEVSSTYRALTAQMQECELCLWCEVWTNAPKRKVKVLVFGTGNPIEQRISDYAYVGTVQTHNGKGVWHVYVERQD